MAEGLPAPFGNYTLLRELGRGSYGAAYLAMPGPSLAGLPPAVVLKRLHEHLARGDFVKRFRHEAEVLASVDSPHLARVYDAGRVGDSLYFTMELIRGYSVSDVLRDLAKSKRLSEIAAVFEVVDDVLAGVQALHEARDLDGRPLQVVHRDLAPKNLMLGKDGRTRVLDLGIGHSAAQDWQTRAGAVLGTPGYLSPEQAAGQPVDGRSDLYAVGVVCFELLTLQTYVSRGPVPQVIAESVAPTFRAPSLFRADVSEAIDELLARALAVDPDRRFATAAEMRAAIAPFVPSRSPTRKLDEILGDRLRAEQASAEGEITRLLRASTETLEPPRGETTIYALGRGVGLAASSGAREDGRRSSSATPSASGTPPTARPPLPSPAPAVRRGGLALGLALAAVGVAGAGLAAVRLREPRVQRIAPIAPVVAVPAPVAPPPVEPRPVEPRPVEPPVVAPVVAPPVVAPRVVSPRPGTKRPPRPPPAKATPSVAPVEAPAPPVAESLAPRAPEEAARQELEALIQRASRRRNTPDPKLQAELVRLLVRMNSLLSSGDLAQKRPEIARLAAELDAL